MISAITVQRVEINEILIFKNYRIEIMEKRNQLAGVVIVVKNGERFVRSALESVLNQDYKPFKVIVVDGNSEDNTLQIVKEFREVEILQQKGSGIYDAFNIGIKACNAPFIALLSSDDIWLSNKLSSQISYMMENPDVLFTNTFFRFFLEPGIEVPEGVRSDWLNRSLPGRFPETLVARKEAFEAIGYFNNEYSSAEDLDWFGRATDFGIQSFMMDDVLLRKRIHDSNVSMQIESNNRNLLKILRRSVNRKNHLG